MDCNVLLTKYWVMSLVIICSTNYILLKTYLPKKIKRVRVFLGWSEMGRGHRG